MNSNSLDAFEKCKKETNAEKVYMYILWHYGTTSQEMVTALNLPINIICGRVNDLKRAGKIQVIGKQEVVLDGKKYYRDKYSIVKPDKNVKNEEGSERLF